MSIVIKRTGRKDNREPTERDEPLQEWRLTFGREKYPTLPRIVPMSGGSVEKTGKGGGGSSW